MQLFLPALYILDTFLAIMPMCLLVILPIGHCAYQLSDLLSRLLGLLKFMRDILGDWCSWWKCRLYTLFVRQLIFVMTVKDSHLHQFTNMTLVYILQVLEVLSSGLCWDNVRKIVHEGQEYQKQNISTSYKQFWIFFLLQLAKVISFLPI